MVPIAPAENIPRVIIYKEGSVPLIDAHISLSGASGIHPYVNDGISIWTRRAVARYILFSHN